MSKRRAQLGLPKTLPPYRTARREWEAAFAALEVAEDEIERLTDLLKQAKEDLADADKIYRGKSVVLREVQNVDKQEPIDDDEGPETSP